jgi:outer membrane murein-binding lipoprotein Lpp
VREKNSTFDNLVRAEKYIEELEQEKVRNQTQPKQPNQPTTTPTTYVSQQTSTELTQAQNQIRVLESERNQLRNELEAARRDINSMKQQQPQQPQSQIQQQQSSSSTDQSLRIRTLESEVAQLRSSLQAATTTTTQVPSQNITALQA